MKKILLIIISVSLSNIVISSPKFKYSIPQPDFVSNDWDGDTIPNATDPDDDNDGILDDNDDIPFGGTAGSGTYNSIHSMTANGSSSDITITEGDTVTISWSSENTGYLTLNGVDVYDPLGLDFTEIFTPNIDTTYILDNGTDTSSITVIVETPAQVVIGSGDRSFTASDASYNGFTYNYNGQGDPGTNMSDITVFAIYSTYIFFKTTDGRSFDYIEVDGHKLEYSNISHTDSGNYVYWTSASDSDATAVMGILNQVDAIVNFTLHEIP